jgi:hypothetical protein
MEDIWTKSEWTLKQLNGRKVEFQFPTRRGTIYDTGKFLVRRNSEGLLSVDILIDVMMGIGKWEKYCIHVPQSGVRRIEKHRDQSIARFRLFV